MDYDRQALIDLVRELALKRGSFTLASGSQSSYYLDCRRVTLDARGAALIAAGMIATWQDDWPDVVGGMELGAVPITAALLAVAGSEGRPLRGFVCRKQAKTHGTGQLLEGPVVAGQSAVVVEDVVTTAGSALKAIDQCAAFGLNVRGVLAVVDRLEGGAEAVAGRGCVLQSLLTIRDLGIEA